MLTIVKKSDATGQIVEMDIPLTADEYSEFWLDYSSKGISMSACRHYEKLDEDEVRFMFDGTVPVEREL
tara:strand:- start:1227 stop:1433 length:207 start_codon:yes stop_codon:yes gene_type:complete